MGFPRFTWGGDYVPMGSDIRIISFALWWKQKDPRTPTWPHRWVRGRISTPLSVLLPLYVLPRRQMFLDPFLVFCYLVTVLRRNKTFATGFETFFISAILILSSSLPAIAFKTLAAWLSITGTAVKGSDFLEVVTMASSIILWGRFSLYTRLTCSTSTPSLTASLVFKRAQTFLWCFSER